MKMHDLFEVHFHNVNLYCAKMINMKLVIRLTLLPISIFCITSTALFSQVQILDSDSGFEISPADGSFPDAGNWQNSDAGGGADASCTTTAAHSGSNGLWIYTGYETWATWSGPYQELSSSPGKAYSASAWIRTPSTSNSGSNGNFRGLFC